MAKSRLYKKLGAEQLIFRTHTGAAGSIGDAAVTDISITRGSNSAESSLPVATAQYTIKGEFPDIVGSRNLIELTDYGANLIAGMAGNVTPGQIKTRFWGRTGIVSVKDYSPDRKFTTIQSSSWLAAVKQSTYVPPISNGTRVGNILRETIGITNLSAVYTVRLFGSYDRVRPDPEKTDKPKFDEVIRDYGTGIGIQIREVFGPRQVQIWSIESRIEEIKAFAARVPHLTRSAAISPAQYSQNIDQWNYHWRFNTTRADGTFEQINFPTQSDKVYQEVKTVDHTYIYRDTGQVFYNAKAVDNRTSLVKITPETITIDILELLTSESEHHRHQAGYLLALQPKDPIFFSGDWQTYLRGVYTAEQIKETIRPDGWTMELSLYPTEMTLGVNLDAHAPKPQTWEAAGALRWNSPEINNTSWEEYGR